MKQAPPVFDEPFRGTFLDLLRWRRDVRRFRADPVDASDLDACFAACDFAPSVGNSQPWRFVLVESESARRSVRESFRRCNSDALSQYRGSRAELYARLKLEGLDRAPVQLAVFCDEATRQGHGLGVATMQEMRRYSVVTAVHTFWLAARCHGIGVGWVSILNPDTVTEVLDVPAHWRLVAYLCVGYPEEEATVPDLERVGWQERTAATGRLLRR